MAPVYQLFTPTEETEFTSNNPQQTHITVTS